VLGSYYRAGKEDKDLQITEEEKDLGVFSFFTTTKLKSNVQCLSLEAAAKAAAIL
jgi:hypothetical protein